MKIFSILLIIVSTFMLNIGLYYTSENYRGFLKDIKQDNIIEDVNDDYNITNDLIENDDNLEVELSDNLIKEKSINNKIEKIKVTSKKEIDETLLSDYFKNLLSKFSQYNLIELKSHSNLMDVTSEYPDDYFEYYSEKLTLYLFPTKSYNEVKEIFEIESDGKFFKINEVDNFGEESFYINLGKDFDDDFVRFIYLKNSNVVGIKVSKTDYKIIKNLIK